MSRKHRSKRRPSNRRQKSSEPLETRTAEAVTVAWLLTAMAAMLAECAAVIGFVLLMVFADRQQIADERPPWAFLPMILLWIAIITGIVCLVLAPVAHRVRRVSPPRSVTVFAVVVGVLPLLTFALLQLLR